MAPKSDRGAAVAGERVERRLVLVQAVAEELDRGDVGQRVDHLAGHHRPRRGAGRGAGADARHEVADQHGVAGEPDQPCRAPSQRLIRPTTATAPTMAVTARPRVLTDLGDRLGDRARGLLLLLGDAAGEVVVEEAQRLAEGVAVQPRQHQRVEVGPEGQRVQRRAEPHQRRAAAPGRTPRRASSQRPAVGDQPLRPARLREVDQPADHRGRRRPRWRRPRSRRRAPSATAGKAPRSTQRMKRQNRSGGGPSARAKASIRLASGFTRLPRAAGSRRTGAPGAGA